MRKLIPVTVLACIMAVLVHLNFPAEATEDLFLTSIFNSPNLVVESIDAPDVAGLGRTVPVSNTIRNDIDTAQCESAGACDAGSFKVGFYLSADSTITTTDIFLGQRAIISLTASASDFAITDLTITAGIPLGGYYVGAIADVDDEVVETDETDNTGYDPISIRARYFLPMMARSMRGGPHSLYLPVILRSYGGS